MFTSTQDALVMTQGPGEGAGESGGPSAMSERSERRPGQVQLDKSTGGVPEVCDVAMC